MKKLEDLLRLGNKSNFDKLDEAYYEELFEDHLLLVKEVLEDNIDLDTERKDFYHLKFLNQLEYDFSEFTNTKRTMNYPGINSFVKEFILNEALLIEKISNRNNIEKEETIYKMLVPQKREFEPIFEKEISWEPYLEKYGFKNYDRYILFRWLKHNRNKILAITNNENNE